MAKKINVIIKEPGKVPIHTNISNTLENLQRTVGGYIEFFRFATDSAIICNEEGKLLNLEYNCTLFGEDFVGTIIFVGIDGEETADLPIDFKTFKIMFGRLWK